MRTIFDKIPNIFGIATGLAGFINKTTKTFALYMLHTQ